jgi:solute carrier family 25 aspartate/glutamate transporter 12/13
MASVKDAVKESLVGSSTDQSQPSHQAKNNFLRYARKDEATGELYMTEDDFVNAIAPKHEDYVSGLSL